MWWDNWNEWVFLLKRSTQLDFWNENLIRIWQSKSEWSLKSYLEQFGYCELALTFAKQDFHSIQSTNNPGLITWSSSQILRFWTHCKNWFTEVRIPSNRGLREELVGWAGWGKQITSMRRCTCVTPFSTRYVEGEAESSLTLTPFPLIATSWSRDWHTWGGKCFG
jgi:hypothetical protein